MPAEPISGAHLHLALTHLLHGELAPAEATLAHAERLADQLSFPQGPYMRGYARWLESWTCIEAGQLNQGAVLAADMTDLGERHGFDIIQLLGATQQATVNGLAALDAGSLDETALEAHATTISTLLDTWRAVGFNLYRTFFDAVVGRLLLAAGQPEQARDHLDTALALAEDTGMRFYDAELLRLRAQTHRDPDARRADVAAALDLARRQGATLFELRAALDDFELRDEPARDALIDVVNRFPDDNAWPELARARAALQ
jgi:tetratricopeptide (TPR) repeat protein